LARRKQGGVEGRCVYPMIHLFGMPPLGRYGYPCPASDCKFRETCSPVLCFVADMASRGHGSSWNQDPFPLLNGSISGVTFGTLGQQPETPCKRLAQRGLLNEAPCIMYSCMNVWCMLLCFCVVVKHTALTGTTSWTSLLCSHRTSALGLGSPGTWLVWARTAQAVSTRTAVYSLAYTLEAAWGHSEAGPGSGVYVESAGSAWAGSSAQRRVLHDG
jgi:hypothetical protein